MLNSTCKGLGGFPPLYKITEEYKKKREFGKEINKLDKNKLKELNILSMKNILKK